MRTRFTALSGDSDRFHASPEDSICQGLQHFSDTWPAVCTQLQKNQCFWATHGLHKHLRQDVQDAECLKMRIQNRP